MLTRQHLGGYRHDLMVALRVVNSVEREIMRAEWDNWVRGESYKCHRVRSIIPEKIPAFNGTATSDIEELRERIDQYCSSCIKAEQQLLRNQADPDEVYS